MPLIVANGVCNCSDNIGGRARIHLAPTSAVVPFHLSLIWAMIGFAVWGDVPTVGLLIGSAIVVGSGLFLLWRERGGKLTEVGLEGEGCRRECTRAAGGRGGRGSGAPGHTTERMGPDVDPAHVLSDVSLGWAASISSSSAGPARSGQLKLWSSVRSGQAAETARGGDSGGRSGSVAQVRAGVRAQKSLKSRSSPRFAFKRLTVVSECEVMAFAEGRLVIEGVIRGAMGFATRQKSEDLKQSRAKHARGCQGRARRGAGQRIPGNLLSCPRESPSPPSRENESAHDLAAKPTGTKCNSVVSTAQRLQRSNDWSRVP